MIDVKDDWLDLELFRKTRQDMEQHNRIGAAGDPDADTLAG
jgi:hypothetical protein